MSVEIDDTLHSKLLNLHFNDYLLQMKEYASENDVPIIQDEGLAFLLSIVRTKQPKRILEIGTAIGYSGSLMALSSDAIVDTIERDEQMYLKASQNIKALKLEDRVNLVFKDALESFEILKNNRYDLIFIDAAKAQYTNFFNLYQPLLNAKGVIVTDNMLFHGVTVESAKSRSLRGLIRKLNSYQEFLLKNDNYDTSIFNIGDGMAVSVKK